MWRVRFSARAEEQVQKLIKDGQITDDDRQVIGAWIRLVEFHGPEILASRTHWCDHPLEGEWWGCRSSAYSSRGRIIYRIHQEQVVIEVVKITPDHDYSKED